MRDNERFIIDLNKKRETAWQQLYEEFYPALCTYVAKLTHENVGGYCSGVYDRVMGFFLAISECQIFGWLALQSSIQQGFEYDS